jgi:hypothetical protein
MSYLPNDSYKYQQSLYNSFNNQLIKGMSQGLSLYSPDEDLKLYKPLNFKPLDNVSFNQINKKIDENNSLFNNAKAVISGAIEGTADSGSNALNNVLGKAGEGFSNFFKNALGIDQKEILTYAGLFLLFMIIYKKI